MSEDLILGIDLGTSNSCVAAILDGQPTVIPNERGERITPSAVHFSEDGTVTVGTRARARAIQDPRHTVTSAKRLIGRYSFSEEVRKARAIASYEIVDGPSHSVRVRIRDRDYSLPEISAWVLREMKRIAAVGLGREVERAVVTVPAYFNDNQRQATKDAGRIAGLDVVRILNEPTAAALSYGFGRDLRQNVAVYDLGGGTFDVSILEIGEDVYEVLSTCGDTFLGGDDFDDRILDVLAEELLGQHEVQVRKDPRIFEKVKLAAEQAKIGLSRKNSVRIEVSDLPGVDGPVAFSYELSRREFEKLVQDLVRRTFKVCDEALQQAGLTVRDLDGVILVGGPTRLPTIRDAVREYFQREPEAQIDPDEVVAMGAAIQGHSLSGTQTESYLLDVTPLSLRLGIAGGLTETILERNTPIPIEQTREFTTVRDNQESVAIRIYQGESRSAEGNELLGEFEFSGFERTERGKARIEVTFAISTEGIVKVSARDPNTGAERSTTVNMSSGLSEEEIQAIVARAEAERPAAPPRREREDPLAPLKAHVRAPSRRSGAPLPEPEAIPLDHLDEGLELPTAETVADDNSEELFGRLEDLIEREEPKE
jgi:molecular chaperone DnaK